MRKAAPVRWRLVFGLALFVVCIIQFTAMIALPALAQAPTTLTAPRLSVPIPGLDFKDYPAYRTGNTVSIPFLAAYISAAYKYLMGVSIVAAAVAIVYGGFQYIIGSSMAKIGRAKEIISDAVIGLLLVLGIYTILATVNPATLNLQGLKVISIKRIPLEVSYNNSLTTTALTGTTPDAPVNATPGLGTTDAPALTECPFTLEKPLDIYLRSFNVVKDPRNAEFIAKIKPLIAGKTFPEAVQFVGDAATRCNITFSSCGYTALIIVALASKEFASCLTGQSCDIGFFMKHSKTIHGITGEAVSMRNKHCWGVTEACGGPPKDGCTAPSSLITQIRSQFPSVIGNGYPESWLEDLQPGDWLYVYSGNNSCTGEHSILFNGWADKDRGLARTVQGPGLDQSKNPKEWKTIVEKSVCLSPKCGNYMPTTLVIRPNP